MLTTTSTEAQVDDLLVVVLFDSSNMTRLVDVSSADVSRIWYRDPSDSFEP
jgi:hypothetical protein